MASINKTPSDMSTWVLGRGGADLNRQDVKDVQDGQKLLDQDLQGQGDLGEESGMVQLVWGVEVSLCSRMNDEGGCGAVYNFSRMLYRRQLLDTFNGGCGQGQDQEQQLESSHSRSTFQKLCWK